MTRVFWGATVLLAVLHELLALRAGSRGGLATGLHRAVLVGLVAAAAFGGDVAAGALKSGTSYKAVVVKDLARPLTVLGRWPGVDQARLGVEGASFGGELALLLAVLYEQVRAAASQIYGGAAGRRGGADDGNDAFEQSPNGCHTMPGVNALVWQEDWFRLLETGPVLVTRGPSSTPRESQAFATAFRPAFAAQEAVDRFVFAVEEGGHEFYVAPVVRFSEAMS